MASARLGPATATMGAATAGISDEGNAQAHDPPQREALPVQPEPLLRCRLQQAAAFPVGQHDIVAANSGWSGAPNDAQNAASAKTAMVNRPLNSA